MTVFRAATLRAFHEGAKELNVMNRILLPDWAPGLS